MTKNYLPLKLADLKEFIEQHGYNNAFILCDSNTKQFCLEKVDDHCKYFDHNLIVVPTGEDCKSLEIFSHVINILEKKNAGKDSVIINLGGGAVSDLGGFVASVYKRGIDYINIPTTLLAMVDASYGGKTGINFNGIKNLIGCFHNPKAIIINEFFLKTLGLDQILSGYAEMLKCGLIFDECYLEALINLDPTLKNLPDELLIKKAIEIKDFYVKHDPFDNGVRRFLNFGHTFGHGFEALSFRNGNPISHGYAVAMGIICELYLSSQLKNFPKEKLFKISSFILSLFEHFSVSDNEFSLLINYMLNDKKNSTGKISCVLLEDIGKPFFDETIQIELISQTLYFYNSLNSINNNIPI